MSDLDDEIRSVRRQEESRGKRSQNIDERKVREQRERERDYQKLLDGMDEKQFIRAIKALGHEPETEAYRDLVLTWKEYQSDKRMSRRKHR